MSLLLLLLPLRVAHSSTQAAPEDEKPPKEEAQEIEGYHEVVVVTAARTEQPLGDAIAMVTAFSYEDLLESPTLVLDDHLRRVPGFSLFRRSSSLVAHPTTQGVSLRGIGPSGASHVVASDQGDDWGYLWNTLRDPVANVTLSVTPSLILRQRENLGSTTAKGIEAEVSYRWGRSWDVWAAYLYSDSRVDDTGLRVSQVPLNQASAKLRFVSEQFEDDRNQLPLERFAVLDLWFQRALNERVALFLSVENVFDQIYPVGRTPIETIGAPRMVHGGVDLRLSF